MRTATCGSLHRATHCTSWLAFSCLLSASPAPGPQRSPPPPLRIGALNTAEDRDTVERALMAMVGSRLREWARKEAQRVVVAAFGELRRVQEE